MERVGQHAKPGAEPIPEPFRLSLTLCPSPLPGRSFPNRDAQQGSRQDIGTTREPVPASMEIDQAPSLKLVQVPCQGLVGNTAAAHEFRVVEVAVLPQQSQQEKPPGVREGRKRRHGRVQVPRVGSKALTQRRHQNRRLGKAGVRRQAVMNPTASASCPQNAARVQDTKVLARHGNGYPHPPSNLGHHVVRMVDQMADDTQAPAVRQGSAGTPQRGLQACTRDLAVGSFMHAPYIARCGPKCQVHARFFVLYVCLLRSVHTLQSVDKDVMCVLRFPSLSACVSRSVHTLQSVD